MEDHKLHRILSYFSFCNYGMYFNFCFCFFAWYSYRNYKFSNRIKTFSIAAGTKNYKSIIKKKKHDKIVLLAKSKLNSIEVLVSSNISHDEFVLIDNVLKEYDEMREEIKNSNNK